MLTATLVTRPANESVKPSAKIIGHAVGAGASITLSVIFINSHCIISSTDHVHGQEYYYPDGVHEVPIP